MSSRYKLLAVSLVFVALDGCYQKTDLFENREITGRVEFVEATELSGLVASRTNPGALWAHNDSGDVARLLALDAAGAHLGEFYLEGVIAEDWEDIAIWQDPQSGEETLYVGDIGDNDGVRSSVTIYRVIDPWTKAVWSSATTAVVPENVITSITVTYPDQPRDAEALLVDPWSNELYILSKRESRQVLYRVPIEDPFATELVAEKVLVLPSPGLGKVRDSIVAADIAADGSEIMVKTYLQMLYWQREEGQSLEEVLSQEPMMAPYVVEKQGEAVAWSVDDLGYFSIPEGSTPIISYYRRK